MAVLNSAMATGRLTRTEYAERLDAAYGATTLGDLEPLTRDLPADETAEEVSGRRFAPRSRRALAR